MDLRQGERHATGRGGLGLVRMVPVVTSLDPEPLHGARQADMGVLQSPPAK